MICDILKTEENITGIKVSIVDQEIDQLTKLIINKNKS